jgi:hypothetical protein
MYRPAPPPARASGGLGADAAAAAARMARIIRTLQDTSFHVAQ